MKHALAIVQIPVPAFKNKIYFINDDRDKRRNEISLFIVPLTT
jgi:hypothetical protein